MARARAKPSPALVVSLLAHAGLLAAAVLLVAREKPTAFGTAVPVTLITDGPPADVATTIEAPEPAQAQAPEPVPMAPPTPAPVAPTPPAPPPPQAQKSTPAPKAAAQKAAPQKPRQQDLDLDSLLASVSSARQPPSADKASGRRGPAQARADTQARTGQGTDTRMSASELGALRDKLQRLWNPNCQVEGAARINVRVRIRLTPDGRLAGPAVDVDNLRSSSDAMVAAAAVRAVGAVGRGAPYTELNPAHYEGWRDIIVTFKGSEACR